ncbi:hypothetical protein TorRG33x02_064250 [Trema orientale]|uniref:Uncharacterized protein n=1 Tax=Trema orientale TaxID=63057 RepID=A0A2P5FJ60_TREOI|nr:hypothetical protein TorRG33x02_064250 [Trema orientale]
MAPTWERNKEQAAHDAYCDRHRHEKLLCLLGRRRTEALDHILIERHHRRENEQRRQRVDEIHSPKPVLGGLLGRNDRVSRRAVDDPQASERGDPIADLAAVVPTAVGEAEEEAGGGATGEEAKSGGPAHGGAALALVSESRGQNLESEDGTGGEEVGQMGCPFESLSHGLLAGSLRLF